MGKLIKLKLKSKGDDRIDNFFDQIEMVKELYLQGVIGSVFIIAVGDGVKYCTSNGIEVRSAKKICLDFIENAKEYLD